MDQNRFKNLTSDSRRLTPYTLGNSNDVLRYTRVIPKALEPIRKSPRATGYDLRSASDYTIPQRGGRILVDTGIKVQLQKN